MSGESTETLHLTHLERQNIGEYHVNICLSLNTNSYNYVNGVWNEINFWKFLLSDWCLCK